MEKELEEYRERKEAETKEFHRLENLLHWTKADGPTEEDGPDFAVQAKIMELAAVALGKKVEEVEIHYPEGDDVSYDDPEYEGNMNKYEESMKTCGNPCNRSIDGVIIRSFEGGVRVEFWTQDTGGTLGGFFR